jgi:hypothetical protein
MSQGNWVPANIARDKLKAATGKGPEVLIAWAANGLLRCEAETWERDWREAEKDVNLPIQFWLGTPVTKEGTPLDAFSPCDWDSNIFRVMVNESGARSYVGGESPYQHMAYFVKFSAEDLTRCIAKLKINWRQGLQDEKPELAPAKLEKWFQDLGSDVEGISQTQLLQLCREAHPNNSITRARIRAKTPGRDRGPKPKPR